MQSTTFGQKILQNKTAVIQYDQLSSHSYSTSLTDLSAVCSAVGIIAENVNLLLGWRCVLWIHMCRQSYKTTNNVNVAWLTCFGNCVTRRISHRPWLLLWFLLLGKQYTDLSISKMQYCDTIKHITVWKAKGFTCQSMHEQLEPFVTKLAKLFDMYVHSLQIGFP